MRGHMHFLSKATEHKTNNWHRNQFSRFSILFLKDFLLLYSGFQQKLHDNNETFT